MKQLEAILSNPPEEDPEINRLFSRLMWTWATQLMLDKIEQGFQLGHITPLQKFHLEYEYGQNFNRWYNHPLSTLEEIFRLQQITANLFNLALEPIEPDFFIVSGS